MLSGAPHWHLSQPTKPRCGPPLELAAAIAPACCCLQAQLLGQPTASRLFGRSVSKDYQAQLLLSCQLNQLPGCASRASPPSGAPYPAAADAAACLHTSTAVSRCPASQLLYACCPQPAALPQFPLAHSTHHASTQPADLLLLPRPAALRCPPCTHHVVHAAQDLLHLAYLRLVLQVDGRVEVGDLGGWGGRQQHSRQAVGELAVAVAVGGSRCCCSLSILATAARGKGGSAQVC